MVVAADYSRTDDRVPVSIDTPRHSQKGAALGWGVTAYAAALASSANGRQLAVTAVACHITIEPAGGVIGFIFCPYGLCDAMTAPPIRVPE